VSRALIAGGGGFIGVHLARRLVEEGYRVDLVDDFSRGVADEALAGLTATDSVRVLRRDLTRGDSLDEVADDHEVVVHLAAIVGVRHVLERPLDTLRANVLMLLPALACARRQRGLRRFVFASTSEVYAGSLEQGLLPVPTPEDATLALPDLREPRTSYMLSKLYGEALCHQAGIPYTIVRPHNVFGPRMGLSHVIPELLHRAHAAPDGGELEVYSVDHRRTFCYVDDAVGMIAAALASPACEGATLNVGRQEPEVSIGELAGLVVRVVGKRLTVVPRPATAGSPARRCPDMSKTRALTGYEPAVDLDAGVERTYAWYASHVFDDPSAAVAR
jgi:nucleoside-diphosphate-sugar epimerase